MTKVAAVLLVGGLILSFNGRWHFMFDNLSSFRLHFTLAFLVCCIIFLVARQRAWLAVSALGVVAGVATIVPWFLPEKAAVEAGASRALKLLVSNVSPRIREHARLEALLLREQPDVVGLVEIRTSFLAKLDKATAGYPYRFEAPKEGFWGLSLYSKLPLSDARVMHFDDDVPPAIVATVDYGDGQAEVILAHPFPPMTADFAERRNRQLEALAAHVRGSGMDTIVLGDLNIALWSPHYRDFVRAAGLRNARRGHGIGASWPSLPVVGVPIDHVLSSGAIVARNFRVLGDIGSDHYPVAAEVLVDAAGSRADVSVSEAGGSDHGG